VTTLSPQDAAELDSLRGALEQLAVQQAVAHASDEDIAAVEKAAERMERAEDEHAMVRCDIAFHDAVYTAARHRRLQEAWQAIRSQVHLFLLTRIGVSAEGYLSHIPGEHRELVAAPSRPRHRDRPGALRRPPTPRLRRAHRHHRCELTGR
jgi:DNA-binding GntR family transcriptional regulator